VDIWDWLRGLRRWWWMIIVFPVGVAAIAWVAAPEPRYESSWSLNIYFDDPSITNNPGYIDFVLLDDFDLLMRTGVLGDVMYTRLPEDVKARLHRDEFGAMFHSSRKARFVEITVVGDDPELIRTVANTLNDNLTEVTNLYLVPPDYRFGQATVNVLDPISDPALNTRDRLVTVGSVAVATLLASIAATGVAEWLRLSYREKYAAR
jgi:hypothetical protein